MKVVCAWCRTVIVPGDDGDESVSHGICLACRGSFVSVARVGIGEFVARLDFPVLVLDSDLRVLEANAPAEAAVGKTALKMRNSLAGVAIECANSLLPGGCGHTTQCEGCRLRNTITATFADGQPRYGKYSHHNVVVDGTTRPVDFRFSTQRIDDIVTVVLEEVKAG